MATRKELKAAIGTRYKEASGAERTKILDEFVAVTGYHRKHAIQLLGTVRDGERQKQLRNRLYDEAVRQALTDPIALLRDIRSAQKRLIELTSPAGGSVEKNPVGRPDVSTFLASLATAWKDGEVRPTHRRKATTERAWRTRVDPFEHAWPVIEAWLMEEPTVTAKELMGRLAEMIPDVYAGSAQLRTLQRRIKA